jgi:hypothetical protein
LLKVFVPSPYASQEGNEYFAREVDVDIQFDRSNWMSTIFKPRAPLARRCDCWNASCQDRGQRIVF